MSQFQISPHVDANKIFLVNRSELEKRLDIDYYRPKIMALEKVVRSKATKKLSDFIVKMASGATPSVTEEQKYYSDAQNGIPFLRVQNLSVSGILDIENTRFINIETHENYLRRSQVNGGDLLVKITGVGRMAIGSVAPVGFIGNTNQHMAVIKTESTAQSWYLANYLNLDIVEALATRRATGGTRPALDYPALRSIPIIEGLDFLLLKKAEEIKKQKQQQAAAFLASIDTYLLGELGITLPEQDNSLEKRMFRVSSREVEYRLDPYYFQSHFIRFFETLANGRYPVKPIKFLAKKITSGITPLSGGDAYTTEYEGIPFIRSGNINIDGNVDFSDLLYLKSNIHHGIMKSSQLMKNDLMIAIVGATIGQVGIYLDDRDANINQAIALVRLKEKIEPQYVKELIKSSVGQMCLNRLKRPVARANINLEEISTFPIVLLPLDKQNEIATHIQSIRTQAAQLQAEATQVLADAKAQIERIILGDS